MNLDSIRTLLSFDQKKTDELIINSLKSNVDLIENIAHYIINNGGKRIRPLLVLLSAKACGIKNDLHHSIATIIEFIHTATLLHDDVVDESLLRRGKETANAVWGDKASILVGDFLYSRAFQMMTDLNQIGVMRILADTTNKISEGEVLQLLNINDIHISEENYFEIIKAKTAVLFAASCALGALISEGSESTIEAFYQYGLNLGIAYQLTDDILDYTSNAESMGKNAGDDLTEGKITLPLIYLLKTGTQEERNLIKKAIKDKNKKSLSSINKILYEKGAINYSLEKGRYFGNLALENIRFLEESPFKKSLEDLVTFTLNRSY